MHVDLPSLEGKVLPCVPCRNDKCPTTPHGFRDATNQAPRFSELCRRYPGQLIGVATGSISNLDVLDIDTAGLPWWRDRSDLLPPTRSHKTRSGGVHLFFRHAAGLRCSASKIAPGVDVRADGGGAIWWAKANLPVLEDAPVAAWPPRLLDLAMGQTRGDGNRPPAVLDRVPISPEDQSALPARSATLLSNRLTVDQHSCEARYALAAMRNAMDELLNTRPGGRNAKLNVLAYSLGRLAVRGWITVYVITQRLTLCCEYNGLARDYGLRQVRATIFSGLSAGMMHPYGDLPARGGP